MTRIKLLLTGILGSILCYYIVDMFILHISVKQYVLIEFVLSLIHWMYNIAKKDLIKKPI